MTLKDKFLKFCYKLDSLKIQQILNIVYILFDSIRFCVLKIAHYVLISAQRYLSFYMFFGDASIWQLVTLGKDFNHTSEENISLFIIYFDFISKKEIFSSAGLVWFKNSPFIFWNTLAFEVIPLGLEWSKI